MAKLEHSPPAIPYNPEKIMPNRRNDNQNNPNNPAPDDEDTGANDAETTDNGSNAPAPRIQPATTRNPSIPNI